MPMTALGRSDLQVSRLALGSWRTYERISRDQGVRVMRAAREAGINFLDDARYNDETGHAPLPTGYSEVVFGELFRAAGWRRDEVVVSNKLWWEFWPDQSPARSWRVPGPDGPGPRGPDLFRRAAGRRGPRRRGWHDHGADPRGGRPGVGHVYWSPEQMERAWQIADREGVPGPVATQPPYSLVRREVVDDPAMRRLAADRGVAIVASYTLAGGILTGKYDEDPGAGRAAGMLDQPQWAPAVAAGRELAALARDIGADPASLAMAFALLDPSVTTVLFGATRPEQVSANLGALALAERLTPDQRDRLAAIGVP